MIEISIDEYLNDVSTDDPSITKKVIRKKLKAALKRKRNGARCEVCGQPIWAAGSALCGTDMCFQCITGESDDSDDYEIKE